MTASHKDVTVIGAGIQGAGVAQAAAAAGHSVLVLEQTQVAAGTSSRSSKLIHGGLRYLETFQWKLVRQSLAERAILLHTAPQLVRLVPFFIPVYRRTARRPWQIRAGLSLYALLGGLGEDARFRKLGRSEWEALDGLRTDDLQAVYCYHDGQTDDAALCRAVLASAVELGAEVKLPAELLGARREQGRWLVSYGRDGHVEIASTSVLVNAAGPWANRVLDRITPAPPRREVDLVAGTHIEVDGQLARGIYYTEAPADQRAVLMMPWKGHTLVGTTEQEYHGDPARVEPLDAEVRYLEDTLQHYFPGRGGQRIDAWSGLRVLPKGEGKAFTRPRDVILVPDDPRSPAFVSIYGGKLTGYRHTAERVMRLIGASLAPCERRADTRTLRLPVSGEVRVDTARSSAHPGDDGD